MLGRKQAMPPRRVRDPDEFASYVTPKVTTARLATAADFTGPAAKRVIVKPKLEARKQQAIRDSANGEECAVRIPGVCTNDTATTIWSHFPGLAGDRGMGLKALDLCGTYCCFACHEVVDMRAPAPGGYSRLMVLMDWMMGHMRSLVRLRQKGLV